VEKIEGRWKIFRDDGREIVQPAKFFSDDVAVVAPVPGPSVELVSARGQR
jgi:hypothetical protein